MFLTIFSECEGLSFQEVCTLSSTNSEYSLNFYVLFINLADACLDIDALSALGSVRTCTTSIMQSTSTGFMRTESFELHAHVLPTIEDLLREALGGTLLSSLARKWPRRLRERDRHFEEAHSCLSTIASREVL